MVSGRIRLRPLKTPWLRLKFPQWPALHCGSKGRRTIYEFGEFRLDDKRRVLQSRTAGQPLQVTGRVFDTLLYFIERPGELLDKRGLMQALWPNVVVEEANLTQTIHTLRRVLGERPDEHRYIVTVPGRGYRFVADVRTVAPADPEPAREQAEPPTHSHRVKPYAIAALSLAMVGVLLYFLLRSPDGPRPIPPVSGAPSIAVLAFADMSPEKNQEHFADGLSEEILNLLAQSSALRVIARTSSFSFKGQTVDIATIAARLNVTHVLEGSVRKSGERIRITAQLVDGATSEHLWSETYDRDTGDVFNVQTDIAAAVANALHVTLNIGSGNGETANAQAYESYLHGRHLLNRRGTADIERAREYFEHAVRLDPNYARAWAWVAGTIVMSEDANRNVPADLRQDLRHAVERAVALGPNLVEAHVRAYQYYALSGNAAAADEHYDRALALNPNDPWVRAALMPSVAEGGLSEMIELQRRMVAQDPLSAVSRGNLGVFLMAAGQWEEAKAEYRKALELSPASPKLHRDVAKILILQGRFDEALAVAAELPEGPLRDQCLALVHQANGQQGAADAALARLIAVGEQPGTDAEFKINIAEVYAYRGNRDEAFKWLTRMNQQTRVENALVPGWWSRQELSVSPFLKPLESDARWQPLLADGLRASARPS
jgi:TolB-like protein/DNA-binding winged helix-turn-helix (wHTH) protein/tetratricopeptide (TPR) repeat protein